MQCYWCPTHGKSTHNHRCGGWTIVRHTICNGGMGYGGVQGGGTSTLMEVSFTTVWVVDNTDSGNGCGVVVLGRAVWFSCRRRSWPLTHPVCTVCVQRQCMGYCLYTYMYNVCVIIYNILYISVSPKLVCRGLTFLGYMDVCVTVYRCLYLSL